jgi:hypothetical protein
LANAKKKRDRLFPQTDFELSLADAVAALIRPNQIEPGDRWHFQVEGDVLKITRIRQAQELPVDDDATAQGA